MKERFVFVLIGDGGFHYNPVPSCLGLAQEYDLPITVVVFNNQRYLSMERGLLRYYPDGAAKKDGSAFRWTHRTESRLPFVRGNLRGLWSKGERSQGNSTDDCSSAKT